MVEDHTAAGNQLKAIAAQHNVEWPAALDDKHRDLRDKLAKLTGAEFDREYMSAMVEGHEGVANKLESRIDKDTLSKWKTESTDRVAGQKAKVEGKAIAVMPERSDNPITMAINQWAAYASLVLSTAEAPLQTARWSECRSGLGGRQVVRTGRRAAGKDRAHGQIGIDMREQCSAA